MGQAELFGLGDGAGPRADASQDATLRAAWRDLVERRLPTAARAERNWPVRLDHCFARILLDAANGRSWREAVAPPAWANTPPETLARALALGEAVLAGEADLHALNAASLAMRGKAGPRSLLPARGERNATHP